MEIKNFIPQFSPVLGFSKPKKGFRVQRLAADQEKTLNPDLYWVKNFKTQIYLRKFKELEKTQKALADRTEMVIYPNLFAKISLKPKFICEKVVLKWFHSVLAPHDDFTNDKFMGLDQIMKFEPPFCKSGSKNKPSEGPKKNLNPQFSPVKNL